MGEATALKTDVKGASILDIPEALYNSRLDDITTIAENKINYKKLVEKIENGNVFLRDPLPLNQGSSYSISVEDFSR